jgi:hypothetical protein
MLLNLKRCKIKRASGSGPDSNTHALILPVIDHRTSGDRMEQFNYPTEQEESETLASSNLQILSKKNGIRARCWCFCSTWTLRYERNTAAETLAVRKEKTISEFKSRLITMMQDLLAKMNFICLFINFESLDYYDDKFEIPVRCFAQSTTQISKYALQLKFHSEGDWQPLYGGIFGSREFTDAQQLGPPWEKCIVHGELRSNNEQRKQASIFSKTFIQ